MICREDIGILKCFAKKPAEGKVEYIGESTDFNYTLVGKKWYNLISPDGRILFLIKGKTVPS